MIDILPDFPDDVAAYACHGHLNKADYAEVTADIEDKLARHEKGGRGRGDWKSQ